VRGIAPPGKTMAVKRELGTASAGQTGTVPPQGRTTNRVRAKAHREVTVNGI
jgi:hypothetical protein